MASDEFLLQPSGQTARTRKVKAWQDLSPVVRVERIYHDMFEKRFKFKMGTINYNEGRDRAILRKLIGKDGSGEEEVITLVRLFFTTTDPQIRRSRDFSVKSFSHWAPRLSLILNGNGSNDLHQRTVENHHEIDKAMGRKQS